MRTRKTKRKTKRINLGFNAVKWPRTYAAEIMDAPRNERTALFEKVPEHWKELVRSHCQCAQDRARMKARR